MDDSRRGTVQSQNEQRYNVIELKIAVLGNSMVGKSALTFRFINNKFPTEHDTTIEDSYSIPTRINDFDCQLEILDTAGQDDYQTMLDTWINASEGFLLVYSIDNKESFESLKSRIDRIKSLKEGSKFAVVIVGNKCDLENKREVQKDEVEKFANSKGLMFLEASALQTINVKEAFLAVAQEMIKVKFPEKFKGGKGDDGSEKKMCYCF